MRAVIYARFSSSNQKETSIEGQLRVCREYAKREKISIVDSYIDRAISGTTDKRPEFQRLITDSEKGMFDMVLFYRFDRFARDSYHTAIYKYQLKQNGVSLRSATENIPETPEGVILEAMIVAMAEYFSLELSKKTKRGIKEVALKGLYHGGILTSGYKLDENRKYILDEEKVEGIRAMFQMYADGIKIETIRKKLIEIGLTNAKGRSYSKVTIANALRNRVYIGENVVDGEVIQFTDTPIISRELWELVQQQVEKNRKAPARNKAPEPYILSGLVTCGLCGSAMCGNSSQGRNGNIYRYYRCIARQENIDKCVSQGIRKNDLEELVVNSVISLVSQEDVMLKILEDCNKQLELSRDSTQIKALQKEIRSIQRKRENMVNAIMEGIALDGLKEESLLLVEAENVAQNKLAKLTEGKTHLSIEDIKDVIEYIKNCDTSDFSVSADLVQGFVGGVKVYPEKVVIALNFFGSERTECKALLNGEIDNFSGVETNLYKGKETHISPTKYTPKEKIILVEYVI